MPVARRYDAAMVRRYLQLRLAAAAAAALMSLPAHAIFAVTEAWVRPAAMGKATEAYMQLMSSDGATLVDVRSDAAASVSLLTAGGRRIAPMSLALPAGDTVWLAPGKQRLALARLARTQREGDRVPFVLLVRMGDGTTQEIAVDAEVRHHSPTDDPLNPHHHH